MIVKEIFFNKRHLSKVYLKTIEFIRKYNIFFDHLSKVSKVA